jgi:ADP-heptose:LPS heptosyltransferase
MEKPSEPSEKVIAVKLPFDLQERILTFPFLHALREKYPEAELHFITPRKDIEILNLLPFEAYYHEFDEDEIENVFDVHRFCANAKIFNVDLFISLTNSFADACIGLGLRAKKRVGFSDRWKTLVLTHKTSRLSGHHVVEDYYRLYELLVGGAVSKHLKVMSRELTPIIPDVTDYIAINLSPIREASIEEEWMELLGNYEGKNIVLFGSEDPEKIKLLMDTFIALLPKKNVYIPFYQKNWIELARMLAFAKGVITFAGPLGATAAYVGSRAILLYDREDAQRTGPFYFLADVLVLGVNDPSLVHSSKPSGSLQARKTFDMTEVFSRSVEFFRL